MKTAIVDYGSGNLRSAAKAFERMAGPGETVIISSDAVEIGAADRIILPGVGAFGDCRRGLYAVPNLAETLILAVIEEKKPFLGICVGMQLMASLGEEHGRNEGFGWIPGTVTALTPNDTTLKVPHMGWNALTEVAAHPVLEGIKPGAYAYFVHSYHLAPDDRAHLLARCDYGGSVTAAVGRENLIGTQFHPEKSQATGLRLISNFLNWKP